MYYEEKTINGCRYARYTPDGKWSLIDGIAYEAGLI